MEYKAAIVGVRMVLVPPKNTSCNCPICGHVAKESRSSRGQFCCRACGYAPPCQQRGCGKYPQGCGQPSERGSQLASCKLTA